jgi:hypothetical protein
MMMIPVKALSAIIVLLGGMAALTKTPPKKGQAKRKLPR